MPTPVLQIENVDLDLNALRTRCEELAKYVRAANAIAALLTQSNSKDIRTACAKVQEGVYATFERSLKELVAREQEQLIRLYQSMANPRTS